MIDGTARNQDDGIISRMSFEFHCQGKQKKQSPTYSCSSRVYQKSNSLHRRLHNGTALNQSHANAHISMNPSPCIRMHSEASYI
jgi:hypothetical protein